MSTKHCNCGTSKKCASTVTKSLNTELTLPISSSVEILEYVLSLKARVDSLVATERKCSTSSETIPTKILDLFSSEIKHYELALRQDILSGL